MFRRQLTKPLGAFVLNDASPQSKGLVGWWPGMANGCGTLFDMSGRGNHGTLTNFASPFTNASGWTAGVDGGKGALAFDGSDDFVSTGQPLTSTEYMLSAWVKLTAAGFYPMIVTCRDVGAVSVELRFNDATRCPEFIVAGIGVQITSVTALALNEWHLITGVFKAGAYALYVDGKSVGTSSNASDPTTLGPLYFGTRSGPSFLLTGMAEDIRLVNRAPSASEVWQLYDPKTRWELRYVLGRIAYSFGVATTGGLLLKRRRMMAL